MAAHTSWTQEVATPPASGWHVASDRSAAQDAGLLFLRGMSVLQDSTPQAAKNPVAFKKVIEIHNTVRTAWLSVGWASVSSHWSPAQHIF